MDYYSPAQIKEAVRGADSLGLTYLMHSDPRGGQSSSHRSNQSSSRRSSSSSHRSNQSSSRRSSHRSSRRFTRVREILDFLSGFRF